eukprot:353108-Chlamydomonas_euryale.AAC.8
MSLHACDDMTPCGSNRDTARPNPKRCLATGHTSQTLASMAAFRPTSARRWMESGLLSSCALVRCQKCTECAIELPFCEAQQHRFAS